MQFSALALALLLNIVAVRAGGTGGFIDTCTDIHLAGSYLLASCGNGVTHVPTSLDLDANIKVENNALVFTNTKDGWSSTCSGALYPVNEDGYLAQPATEAWLTVTCPGVTTVQPLNINAGIINSDGSLVQVLFAKRDVAVEFSA